MLVSVIRSGFRDASDVVFRRGWFSETARYTPMISMRNLISYKVSACCKRCDVFLCTNLNVHLLFIRIIAQHSFFEFLLALHHRSLSWYSGDKRHRMSFKLSIIFPKDMFVNSFHWNKTFTFKLYGTLRLWYLRLNVMHRLEWLWPLAILCFSTYS